MCTGSSELSAPLRRQQRPQKMPRRLRMLRLQRRRRGRISREAMKMKLVGGKKEETLEIQNLELFMKNQSIIHENELLRERALLLHQENTALLLLLKNKFSAE